MSWCKNADPGYFVDEAGSTKQSKCQSGYEQEMSGQIGCTKIERPLWMSILMFGIPAVVLGTMAVLYISNSRKSKGRTKDRSYMYAEDIRKKT
jgi:hypothetical protein